MWILRQVDAVILSFAIATPALAVPNPQTANAPAGQNQGTAQAPPMESSVPSPKELQPLVAPIALYPDALIGQILAGATYPTQVVEAERWVQQNSSLKGEKLAAEVDKQPWDPSIKALTQFPSVLQNMSRNLSWTSSLGDAYFNDPDGVMTAIQALRKDATNAGTLKSTPEQTVKTEGQTIVIQPANPEVVYVPQYSPAVVYGTTVEPYPGYSGWEVAGASALSFGAGMFMGAAMSGWGWGWGHWDMDWHGGNVNFNRNAYVSRSNTFANRNTRYNAANRRAATGNVTGRAKPTGTNRTGVGAGGGRTGQGFSGRERLSSGASRGFGQAGQASRGTRGNTFSGLSQGGSARKESLRGSSSFRSGGGGFRGGGGFGGGRRGGGRRR
jgi:Protein of unknown function (DUF3300)